MSWGGHERRGGNFSFGRSRSLSFGPLPMCRRWKKAFMQGYTEAAGGRRLNSFWSTLRADTTRLSSCRHPAIQTNPTFNMTSSVPAHLTKHIPRLQHPFNNLSFALAQRADGVSNGTALWLSGQCLSIYLADTHAKFASAQRPPRALELGSGIGLTACVTDLYGFPVRSFAV